MDLREETRIGAVTVTADGFIEVRRETRILRGDVLIAGPAYQRHVLAPGAGLEGEDPLVQEIAGAAWTPERLAAEAGAAAPEG